jgi:hypothetical protein
MNVRHQRPPHPDTGIGASALSPTRDVQVRLRPRREEKILINKQEMSADASKEGSIIGSVPALSRGHVQRVVSPDHLLLTDVVQKL